MKKLLAAFLTLVLLFGLCACAGNKNENNNSQPDAEYSFVAPENYETVLTVKINPEFKLYLDASGKVLAVESVNDDAKAVADAVNYENQNFRTVLKLIIVEAHEKGFVKENAKVQITAVKKDGQASEIASDASLAVTEAADELKVVIVVDVDKAPGKDETDATTSDKDDTASNQTSKPSTSKPTTSTTSKDDTTSAKEKLLNILENSSYLAQYLTVYYDGGSAITPKQVMTYVFTDICYREGFDWGDKVPSATFYKYAAYSFVMDDKMINKLKASEYYNASDDTYTLYGEYYSNSVHCAYVNAYDELGNNEYTLYIKYGAWDSNPDTCGFYDITCWKAKVKIREKIDNMDFSQILFYSIEKINAIPATATPTNIERGF